jgi:hypothetical protein
LPSSLKLRRPSTDKPGEAGKRASIIAKGFLAMDGRVKPGHDE